MAILKPKMIVALVRYAAHHLLKTDVALGRLRNTIHQYGSAKTPLIVTYHPAYLLRNPSDKSRAYDDLLLILKQLT